MTQPVRRVFPGGHDQVSRARAFVRTVVRHCPMADDAILLTSELCTNALQHTASGVGGTFEITIHQAPGSLRIEVRDDGSSTIPVRRSLDGCSEDGRGLEIVALIAHRWGQNGDEYGRAIYFEFRWASGHVPEHAAEWKAVNMTQPSAATDQSQRLATISTASPARDSGASVDCADPGIVTLEAALLPAEQLLISTADIINPGTSAAELLRCLTRYRKCLAALTTACRRPDDTPCPHQEHQ